MKTEQFLFKTGQGWDRDLSQAALKDSAQLVLIFGATEALKRGDLIDSVKQSYPKACLFGCSTAGEIHSINVHDDSIILTAVFFEKTTLKVNSIRINSDQESFHIGQALVESLEKEGLAHVFVLSDGLGINGSDLVRGMLKGLPEGIVITGGLAGDGARFGETLVFQDGQPQKNVISILGFYGKDLKVGYGSVGGWDPFGPERLITRSKGNILYEFDNESALGLYKKYLGEYAKGLPSTGLLFPLSIRYQDGKTSLVRTILAINEEEQSLTFAGDVPEKSYARLMKANFDRLIDGAVQAARNSCQILGNSPCELAILISCIGRKLVLKQRVEEELEGVNDIFKGSSVLAGFYSYGEIAPFQAGSKSELHNQTMTITAFSEK